MRCDDPRESRHLPLIERLSGKSKDVLRKEMLSSRVLVASDMPREEFAGVRIAVTMLVNMISRFCPRIDLFLPGADPEWLDSAVEDARGIDSREGSLFRAIGSANPSDYAVNLSIGPTRKGTCPSLQIGWSGCHSQLSEGDSPLQLGCEGQDLFGIAGAAIEGAAGTFWKLLRPEPVPFLDAPFCWRRLTPASSCSGDVPTPPRVVLPPTLLAGAGAVGQAIAQLLAFLQDVEGLLMPVDFDRIEPPDLGRLAIARERDLGRPKVTLIKAVLGHHRCLRVEPLEARVKDVAEWIECRGLPFPKIAISGLDRWVSRAELSHLVPDHVIEGSTDELAFRRFRSDYGSGMACLLCSHGGPQSVGTAADWVRLKAAKSGLSESIIEQSMRDPEAKLREEDLQGLSSSQSALFRGKIGKPICTVLEEFPVAEGMGGRPHQLVVSFVSMAAALASLSDLLTLAGCGTGSSETLYQGDFRAPLSWGHAFRPNSVPECECRVRRKENDLYRQLRQAKTPGMIGS